jgi:hypothetical protein
MKTASAKAKGRNLQKYIVSKILAFFPHLQPTEVTSRSMGAQGTDILLSDQAIQSFPYSIEAKCQESLNIWNAIKQAETNILDKTIPLLVFKRNRSDVYCCMKFEDLLQLTSNYKQLETLVKRLVPTNPRERI